MIQPNITKYLAIMKANPMKSGMNEDNWHENLKEEFRTKYGRPFLHLECFYPLTELPKFDPNFTQPSHERDEDDEASESSKSAFSAVATQKKRLMGVKKAKAKVKEEKGHLKVQEERNETLAGISRSMQQIASSMEMKAKRDHHTKMFKILMETGMKEKAMDHLKALDELDSKPAPNKPAPPTEDSASLEDMETLSDDDGKDEEEGENNSSVPKAVVPI